MTIFHDNKQDQMMSLRLLVVTSVPQMTARTKERVMH